MAAPIYKTKMKDEGEKDGKVIAREKEASEATEKKQVEKTRSEGDKNPAGKEAAEGAKEGGEEKPAEAQTPQDRHAEERNGMAKRHESESRDHFNNHREAMKQMHTRQLKDMAELNKRHMAEMASQGGPGGEAAIEAGEAAEGDGKESVAAA